MDKITVSLAEVLAENSTLYIKDHGRGALATASFRGTAATHTQVFWNGININSPMLGMVDFSLIPTNIIDELSMKHGAASIGEQSGGIGGSVNIGNQADWGNTLGIQYTQGIGNYSTYDELGQLSIGNRIVQSKTRLYHNYSLNDYSFVNKALTDRPVMKNQNAAFGKKGLSQELYYRASQHTIISMKIWGQESFRSLPTVMSFEGDLQSNLNRQEDKSIKAVTDITHYRKQVKYYGRMGYDYQHIHYHLMNQVSGAGTIPAIYSNSAMKSWYNHLKVEWNPNPKLSIHASADLNRFDVTTNDTVTQLGYNVVRNDLSLFSAAYWNLNHWLNLSLMVREDRVNDKPTPLIFHAGTSVKPYRKLNLVWSNSFSRNYHHPGLNDLYWQPGGNPNLKPEEGYTAESSVKHQWIRKGFFMEQNLTAYHSDIHQWILWLPGFKGYWEPFNVKKVKSYGLEYHASMLKHIYQLTVSMNGNYAYTRSINHGDANFWGDESVGKQLPFIPVHSANILIGLEYKKFYLKYQNNSYGERYTMTSNQAGLYDDSNELEIDNTGRMGWYYPYFMNNISVGKNVNWKNYRAGIDFKINNLLNETYRSVLGRYMPGRNYQVVIRIAYAKRND
jgi:outer membrane cobalamin receptor